MILFFAVENDDESIIGNGSRDGAALSLIFQNDDEESIGLEIVSQTGTDAEIEVIDVTDFESDGFFLNKTNVLGYQYVIQDSRNHFHTKSYTIESSVGKNYADAMVKESLHHTGLYRHYRFLVRDFISNQNLISVGDGQHVDVYRNRLIYTFENLPISLYTEKLNLNILDSTDVNYHMFDNASNLNYYKFLPSFDFPNERYGDIRIEDTDTFYFKDGLNAQIDFT